MTLWEMTLSGAGMVVVIVLIRALAINRLPKKTFVFLWSLAVLRLLLPFSIPSPFSVQTIWNRWLSPGEAGAPVLAEGEASVFSLFTVLWLGGLGFCVMFLLVAYLWNYRKFRRAELISVPWLDEWAARQGIRRKVQIRISDRITSPLTYGVLRPVILLPDGILSKGTEELRYILTHESIHIRRFDVLFKFVLATAVCLHWFNPFCWVLCFLANRDLEMSCDEAVLHVLGRKEKAAYAKALVRMEEQKPGFLPLTSHFNKNALEERVIAILKGRGTSRMGILASVALILLVAAVFSTSALAEAAPAAVTPPSAMAEPGPQEENEPSPYMQEPPAVPIPPQEEPKALEPTGEEWRLQPVPEGFEPAS